MNCCLLVLFFPSLTLLLRVIGHSYAHSPLPGPQLVDIS